MLCYLRNRYLSQSVTSRHISPSMTPMLESSLYKRTHFIAVLACLLVILLTACAQPPQVAPVRSVNRLKLLDNGTKESLRQAAERSLSYYQRMASQQTSPKTKPHKEPPAFFNFGEHRYSANEMAHSMRLFLELLAKASSPQELSTALKKQFLLFEVSPATPKVLFTGYFEPKIAASHQPSKHLNTPLYARPKDLIEIDLSRYANAKLPNISLFGKVYKGRLQPYDSRRQIQQYDSLKNRAEIIAWVNEVDLFFLQIQGSGILRFANNKRIKVGYAATNSHPYRSIGSVMARRELMSLEQITMQSLRDWIKAHPSHGRQIMLTNPSYVFFEVRKKGPLGNIQLELTAERSLALDSSLLPQGALTFVSTQVPAPSSTEENGISQHPFQRFMLVQDTGGAIRGYQRGDIFFGTGASAEWKAGQMKHDGRLFLLAAKKTFLPSSAENSSATQPEK